MRATLLSFLVAIVALTLTVGPASADDAVRVVDRPVTDAAMVDLAFLADGEGITLTEAIRDYGWEPALAEYVEELRVGYDSFAGARINDDRSVTIGFKGAVPDEVLVGGRLDGLVVEFLDGLSRSEEELRARQLEVHHAFRDAGFEQVSTGFRFDTGRIDVEVRQEDPSVTGAALDVAVAADDDVDVTVHQSDLIEPHGTLYGGGRLEKSGSSLLGCTAGFKVQKGSINGFVTAGHCFYNPDVGFTHENWGGVGPEFTVARQYPVHFEGMYGDYRWYSTTETESDDFYYNWGVKRDLTSVAGIPLWNQTLYRFGNKTGMQYDKVWDTQRTIGNGLYYVVMTNKEADGGDSGGPWFSGSVGYGIHYGAIGPLAGQNRDFYSRLDLVDNALPGVAVSTS